MTRKSKRELERKIAELRGGDDPGDIEVTSSTVTVTEDDVEEDGNVTDLPEPALPEGFEVAGTLDTASDVVTVQTLAPTADTDGG